MRKAKSEQTYFSSSGNVLSFFTATLGLPAFGEGLGSPATVSIVSKRAHKKVPSKRVSVGYLVLIRKATHALL